MRRAFRDPSRIPLKLMRTNERTPGEALDALAEHCIAARKLIDACGTQAMRKLIDMLLFEVAFEIAAGLEEPQAQQEKTA